MIALRSLAKVLCVGALAALTACGFASVPYNSGNQSSGRSGSCNPSTGVTGQVRVCPGDTLTGISRQENVTVLGIMRENGLADDRILVGQVLTMPNETVHVVQPGDQLLSIANRYNVQSSEIVAANELRRPYTIFPEQRLAIPLGPVGSQTVASQRLPDSPPVTNDAPGSGVTIGTGVPPASAPASVPADDDARQSLPVADDTPPPSAIPSDDAPTVAANNAPVPRNRASEPSQRASATANAPSTAPSAPAASKPAATASASFLLPVQGRIVSEFGPKSGGLHNDGINIAAPRGTPILATADGEVAYAGDGLPGFGNLILLRHEDGWTSAYAHADSMAVKRGDPVTRGATIGTVGNTGSVTEPQLHFELRKHDRAVDPKPLLGP
jgi:murein DD-endopeptidase MepM/ murein hydrolase activator NlpD